MLGDIGILDVDSREARKGNEMKQNRTGSSRRIAGLTILAAAIALTVGLPAGAASNDEPVRVAVLAFDTFLVEPGWDYSWEASRLGPLATSMWPR